MLLRVVIILAFSLLTDLLHARPDTVRITNTNPLIELNSQVEFYLDRSSRLSLKQVIREYRNGNFFSEQHPTPNFTGQRGTIWFRFVVKSEVSTDIAVALSNIFIERLNIFICRFDGTVEQKQSGFLWPYHLRDFVTNDYIISLNKSLDPKEIVIYGSINCRANPPMIFLMKVGTLRAILADNRTSEFLSIGVLGALLIMLLYNFCLAVVIRDRLYLYYCFYITTAFIVIMWFNGYLFVWFSPDTSSINPYPWQMGLFYLGQLVFANKLLRIKESLPVFFRFSLLIYVVCIVILAAFILPFDWLNVPVFSVGLILPLYFLLVSIRLCLKGVQVAFVFLLGWFPILTVTIFSTLMMLEVIHYNLLADLHAVELSLTWELVIFSLALGFRYNSMRSEKLDAQAENIKMIKEQKLTLRKLVIEQTEEILVQNDKLLRNQEEIKLQNERLETQNKAYERLKEMILRQNHELETSVQRRTLQLAQSNEELKKHVHQLEQFSFIAAHNLRAPVARILGLVNILDYVNPGNPDNSGILNKIVASAHDLDVIVHDLGAILDAQKNKIEKTECIDINRLIEKIIHRHKPDIDHDGIIIETLIAAPCVVAVPAYLDSILSNLISNSVKYRAEHRTPIILIATEETNLNATIIVHDNGIGFDSKLFNHKLFEPFQRFHTHKDGKGLGMFLVKTQVIAMNGTIALTSEPDVGTHVIITLPKS
jgi:two-component system, sensor histidine kinase LadS